MLTRRRFLHAGGLAALATLIGPDVATRLLMAAHGSGGFGGPSTLTTTAFTSAPAGGWTWFNGPCAVHSGSKTYFGYVKGTNGDLCARTIDDGTLTVGSENVVYPAFQRDDHEAPSMLVRASDGYVCMGFTTHVGDPYFAVGASAGALPTGLSDVTNIASSVGAPTGAAGYTYAGLCQVSAEANTLYMFLRWHDTGGTAHLSYSKSTNNGSTWGARVDVLQMTYHQFAVNGSDRIDFVCSPHPTSDAGPHSIYHFYKQGANYYKSDGTQITASLPFSASDLTLVYDGTSTDGWMWDIAIQGGQPVITYATFPSTSDHRANYATWNGSAWTSHEIVSMGGYFPTSIVPGAGAIEDHYSGGVVLDRTDPRTVYVSVNVSSGRWDIYRYRTLDSGASWIATALTSSGKNIRPVAVQGYGTGPRVLWMSGTYTTYTDYSTGTSGAG